MRVVLELLSSLAGLLKLWLRQRYGERREADRAADRAAVRDDAGGEWVQHSGGTDRRDKPGSADAGGRHDG